MNGAAQPVDPASLIRSKEYRILLVLAALILPSGVTLRTTSVGVG
jgi:hypothetical protein